MKRMMFAVLASLAMLASPAAADQPQFFLKADGTVEQRVTKVESDVEKLKVEVAALKEQLATKSSTVASTGPGTLGSSPSTFALKPAAAAPAAAKLRYQVCENGRCTIYEVDAGTPIPLGAKLLDAPTAATTAAAYCPCGDTCPCAGASLGVVQSAPSQNRGLLFPNRPRLRGGWLRGCSSCGG